MGYKTEMNKIMAVIKRERKNYFGKRDRYDMRGAEWVALAEEAKMNPLEATSAAFDYGFIKGMRYCKKYGVKGV